MISKERKIYNKEYWDLKAEIAIEVEAQYIKSGITPTFEQIDKVSAMVAKDKLGIGLCDH